MFEGERVKYQPEYLVQYLTVYLWLLIQRLLSNVVALERN
jgi:hypothetical protein